MSVKHKPLIFAESPDNVTDGDLHHLLRVRRMRAGDRVYVCNGRGLVVPCALALDGVRIDGPAMQYRPDEPRLGIAMFMPSNERLDWAVQKISETGADDIFLITDTNDRRGGRTISQARIDRLRRVIREACAQAGRVFLPILHEPMRLADFLEKFQNEVALCAPGGAGPTLDRVIWLIGPESGLVSVQAGIPEVSLSPNVLRIETAAVVASAIQVALRARLLAHPNI